MRMNQIKQLYPEADSVIRKIMVEDGVPYSAVEGLTPESLRCIDAGIIPAADVRMLLRTRGGWRKRA